MRSQIKVARHVSSNGSYLIGEDARAILSRIDGISAVTVDQQTLDGATLSFQSTGHTFDRLDQMLDAKGLRRV
jgi:hypothetical protein